MFYNPKKGVDFDYLFHTVKQALTVNCATPGCKLDNLFPPALDSVRSRAPIAGPVVIKAVLGEFDAAKDTICADPLYRDIPNNVKESRANKIRDVLMTALAKEEAPKEEAQQAKQAQPFLIEHHRSLRGYRRRHVPHARRGALHRHL